MIPVTRCDEPANFDQTVRQPGLRWLREKLGEEHAPRRGRPVQPVGKDKPLKAGDLRDFWTCCLPDMHERYRVCAYAGIGIREGGGTVDHFEAKGICLSDPNKHHLIYEWSNFRYAFSRINSAKGEKTVLDPFAVRADWFQLDLVSLRVNPREHIPEPMRTQILDTIRDLGLNSEWLIRLRADYLEAWERGEVVLTYLRRYAPFIAGEIERQRGAPLGGADESCLPVS